MGFSALDGLMMGSRCGQLDPGVVLHLWREGWTEAQVEQLLYKESGLLGVSGLSADMRLLRRAADDGNAQARTAIDLFTYRLTREAGALAAVLGGVDVLVCTGGIGEHDPATRAALAQALHYLGVVLDGAANTAARGDGTKAIHGAGSAVEVWVVPTDEGRVAAQAAWALLDTVN
jgi:acetate kinase